jgi:ubiquinone/menaquinone biosynthesis C-methylase UbiE
MSEKYDLALFQGVAEYYARYRPKRPRALFDFLVQRFGLDRTCRLLDLGCGTGNASFPLAPLVGEILAMDPDPDMVRVARDLATRQGLLNVRLLQAGSEDLSADLGSFRLVVMGESFHWMNRDQVLQELSPLVEKGGGIALIGPAHGFVLTGEGPPKAKLPWQQVVDDVLSRYVGARRRHPRSNPNEPRHEQAIARSSFKVGEYHEFESEWHFQATDVIGLLYSMSGNLRAQLGTSIAEFEVELMAELLRLSPNGRFIDRTPTAVLVAIR